MVTLAGETAEVKIAANPDRMIMLVQGLRGRRARGLANNAARLARQIMPKLTGQAASRLFPLYGDGYFGIGFQNSYVWFQEQGIRPFTMYHLAGKTIPMWVDDPAGELLAKNPRAQTRVTMSGKPQILIFRRAPQLGQRRTVRHVSKVSGEVTEYSVPMSYPGAPGHIGSPLGRREAGRPWTTPGRTPGAIAQGNIGVRWRHPGLAPRKFLNRSMTIAAQQAGIIPVRIYAADRYWRSRW